MLYMYSLLDAKTCMDSVLQYVKLIAQASIVCVCDRIVGIQKGILVSRVICNTCRTFRGT